MYLNKNEIRLILEALRDEAQYLLPYSVYQPKTEIEEACRAAYYTYNALLVQMEKLTGEMYNLVECEVLEDDK